MLRTTNIPSGEPLCEDFSVLLDGKQVQTCQVRVSAVPFCHTFKGKERSLDQTELASMLCFSADEPVKVELKPARRFDKVTIRPLSEKIIPQTENGKISFSLTHPGQYVVELDGPHCALHIFYDPIKDFGVLPNGENTLYYGAEHTSRDFIFENITFNGRRLTSKEELNLTIGKFVDESEMKIR